MKNASPSELSRKRKTLSRRLAATSTDFFASRHHQISLSKSEMEHGSPGTY
jgi:hypothetical protein